MTKFGRVSTEGITGCRPAIIRSPSFLAVSAREERRRFFKSDTLEFRAGDMYAGGGGGGARFRPEENSGKLLAITPDTGEIRWAHDLLTPHWSGVLSTAGNLVFSSTMQGNFFALDAQTGKELWHFPGGDKVYASPIKTFLSRGKQFVTLPIGRRQPVLPLRWT